MAHFFLLTLTFLLTLSVWPSSESARAASSAGCGLQEPEHVTRLTVGGEARSFILSVPEPYDPNTLHALVFAFHGRTSPAEEVQGYYDLEAHAAGTLGPTIFVYPVALRQSDGTFGWWESSNAPGALRDFTLFDALTARLSKNYCVNTGRIYAVGHSLGGSFVNALGCYRATVLRGIASLGAGPGASTCRGEVAAMILHNPDDELVAFEDGLAARDQYLMQNGLRGPPAPSAPCTLNCVRYGAAGVANLVLWCPHTQDLSYGGRYYPHNWPAETGRAVMRFFASLP